MKECGDETVADFARGVGIPAVYSVSYLLVRCCGVVTENMYREQISFVLIGIITTFLFSRQIKYCHN